MAGRGSLRASDADRERAADRLRQAAGEGRLRTEELERRLEDAFNASTYAQLDAVLLDLPGRRLAPPAQRRSASVPPAVLVAVALPVAMVAIIATVLVVTGVFAGWMLWVLAGWWFFGRHRRRLRGPRYAGSLHGCGTWHRGRDRPPGHWA